MMGKNLIMKEAKKMKENNKANYYVIIPADVRYDNQLTEKAKLLYGEIACLSNKEGYCYATNKYFARLYNCTTRSIQNAISKLEERGYIKVIIKNNYQRKIFISYAVGQEKNFIGDYENSFIEANENKFTYNNINNKIDILFNYIIENKKEVPKEFKNVEKLKIIELLDKYEMLYTKNMIAYMQRNNLDKIKEITYVIALIVKDNLQEFTYNITRDKLIYLYNKCKAKEMDYKETDNEIDDFIGYYYKTIQNEMIKRNNSSIFLSKN